ncbi:MAG TPA: M28 family peptidase [Thermomicrobiales bacterium]|nr:M28 family peptidase [Thermomicrobiales bacterium]
MSLDEILDDLSEERTWRHLTHITEQIPSRLAGTPNARRMAEYAAEQLANAGLDARMDEFLGLVSFPKPAEVQVIAPERWAIEASTLAQSPSTAGLDGELIYIGAGSETDYDARDVRGKITLTDLPYAPARHEKAYIAARHGVVAQVMMNWGHPESEAIPLGSVKSAWGNPTPDTFDAELPRIPCVGISLRDGLRLKALCDAGAIHIRLRAEADNGWHNMTMTSGSLGADPQTPFLLVGGHMDSWFGPQATDNASGNACMLELARVFSRHRSELRRGLVTAFWMGHETGTMVSSTRFADINWDWLRRSCVAYLQIDQPAITGTSTWHLASTEDTQGWATRAAGEMLDDMDIHWRRQRKNGDSSFFGVGLSTVAGMMSFRDDEIRATGLANLGWWHHSVHNTLDKVDRRLLLPHLRVYARWMWDLLTAPVLPYEYAPFAGQIVTRLDTLTALEVPDIDMAGAVERAREFRELASRLDALAASWRGRKDLDQVKPEADTINRVLLELARTLIPVTSTTVGAYGQDRYGHSWQPELIPSLAPYPRLTGYDRDSEAFQTWWVSQVRARNRVVDALDRASEVVRTALRELNEKPA